MQLLPRYLVKNKITLVANEAGFVTEYNPVYQRHVQVYKGIDNILQFKLLNADQKPINTNLYTPVFVAFDENKHKVIEKDCIVLDDGSSASKGLFQVTITEGELLNADQQYFSYTVYLVDQDNVNVLTYTDSHFGNNGIIYISGDAFPSIIDSKELSTFTQMGDIWYSESIDAQPTINNNTALHTAVVYTENFVGNVTVQSTLENQITGTTAWADIATISFTGTETEPKSINFNGVFNYIRFMANSDPANINKILVRN